MVSEVDLQLDGDKILKEEEEIKIHELKVHRTLEMEEEDLMTDQILD